MTGKSDLTYDDVVMSLLIMQQQAEEEAEAFAARASGGQVDELAASGLDPATLDELAAIDDCLAAQEKAARATADAAATALHGIKRRHNAIADAAQAAPAEMAESEFYVE